MVAVQQRDGRQPASAAAFSSHVPAANQHPAAGMFPTTGSPLQLQLAELGRRQADIAPVERRLDDLLAEQKEITAKYDRAGKDWQCPRGVLRELEAEAFDIGRLIAIVRAELERRHGRIVESGMALDSMLRDISEHRRTIAEFTIVPSRPLPNGYSPDKCKAIVEKAKAAIVSIVGHDTQGG